MFQGIAAAGLGLRVGIGFALEAIKEIAETRVRYGCRRITALLKREG